jgi:hypothetical protein
VLRSDGQLPAALCQPYRVVCNATIEAFFEGSARSDVRSWGELLGRYQRAYWQWFGTLRMECGAFFDRSPPEENRSSFWDRILGTCGGLAAATGKLVAELRITFFGRYRCHQRPSFPDLEAESASGFCFAG